MNDPTVTPPTVHPDVPEPVTSTPAPEMPEISKEIQQLTLKAGLVAERLRADPTTVDTTAIEAELEEIKGQMVPLIEEQGRKAKELQIQTLMERVQALEAMPGPRKIEFPAVAQRGSNNSGKAWDGKSFAYVLAQGRKGNPAYAQMLYDWHASNAAETDQKWGTKALAEGASTTGGFLVPAQYIQELVMLRRATAPLLRYVRVVPVRSNLVYVPTQTGVSTVGWTAENAVKPSTDEILGQVAVNVYTLAGIAKVSNQLLEDSTPAVDAVVREDLLRGLNIEMDRTVLNGSGTGQSTGILNTAGVTVTPASAQTAASLIDDTLSAIGRLQAAYFGNPDAIVYAPRTWTKLQTAKDTTGRYIALGTVVGSQALNMPGLPNPTGATDDNMGMDGGPVFTMFGFPLVIDANMPIAQTVGGNTNRSSIVVGALRESWLLDRQEIRMDVSSEAGSSWETNQTWFRGETRVGFTAARLPTALQVVSDVGP